MKWLPIWLADADPADIMAQARGFSDPAKQEIIIFLLALGGCVFLVLLWAMFVRKPGGRRHRHRQPHHGERQNKGVREERDDQTEEDDEEGGIVRRRRRRRREHRPLNPTLAETGGLPPRRTDPSSNSPSA
jgi:type VI protein secretion system component VasK